MLFDVKGTVFKKCYFALSVWRNVWLAKCVRKKNDAVVAGADSSRRLSFQAMQVRARARSASPQKRLKMASLHALQSRARERKRLHADHASGCVGAAFDDASSPPVMSAPLSAMAMWRSRRGVEAGSAQGEHYGFAMAGQEELPDSNTNKHGHAAWDGGGEGEAATSRSAARQCLQGQRAKVSAGIQARERIHGQTVLSASIGKGTGPEVGSQQLLGSDASVWGDSPRCARSVDTAGHGAQFLREESSTSDEHDASMGGADGGVVDDQEGRGDGEETEGRADVTEVAARRGMQTETQGVSRVSL